MAASINDYFRKASNGTTRPVVTYLQSAKTYGSDTATINAATGWNTTTGVDVQIYSKDTSGNRVPGSETDWVGTLSGTTLSNLTLKAGTEPAAGYPAGTQSVVICSPTAAWADSLVTGILAHADQDGTLKADSVDNTAVIKDGVVSNAKLSEIAPSEFLSNFVYSGGVVAQSAGLVGTFSNIVYYISGIRYTKNSVANKTYTVSKDTYVDIDAAGTVTYTEVANNAASPALTAGRIRVAIVTTSGSAITGVNQGEPTKVVPIASSVPYATTDSLGNLIYPSDPQGKIIGYRQIVGNFVTASQTATQATGLTCPVIIPTGRKVRISAFARQGNNSTGTQTLSIWDGTVGSGTKIAETLSYVGTANSEYATNPTVIIKPSSTSKTYNVGFHVSGNTGTIFAGSTSPAFIMVELV